MYKMFRDDDICITSNSELIYRVHNLFIKHNKIHTIAVLMDNIWDNKEIWYWMMTAKNLEICLHGWTHTDFSKMTEQEIREDLTKCFDYWKMRLECHKKPYIEIKKFLPPWNRVSDTLKKVCSEFGLEVDNRVGGEVYNFHYWALYDTYRMDELDKVLSIPQITSTETQNKFVSMRNI